MTQVDIARVALGAPALQQVFVVSRPECLLIKAWARNEHSNMEDAAALIGNLFRDCDDALAAVGGQNDPRTLMVEAADRVVVVSRVAEDMAAAFVFEPTAPLGLIRVQARQLTAQLARTLASTPAPARTPPEPPSSPNQPGLDRPVAFTGPSIPPRVAFSDLKAKPAGLADAASRAVEGLTPHPTIADHPPPSPEALAAEAARAAIPRMPEPRPVPPLGMGPTSSPGRADLSSGRFEQLALRVSSFAEQAPDARSALLRLSLRTGLPMELLERVTSLSPAQADLVSRALDELQKKTTS